MNLFVLDACPIKSAELQCDKHVVKMIVESAQMLSTVHRMLDGTETTKLSKSGKRTVKYWEMQGSDEQLLYKAVHMNHPCTVWSRETHLNYLWHYIHFCALCDEYTYRYGKTHSTDSLLRERLRKLPRNIPHGHKTPQPLAMGSNPECMDHRDIVGSYRKFYSTKAARFSMDWTKREVPSWFSPQIV